MSFAVKRRGLGTVALLGGPVLLCALAIVVPLVLTLMISFWERQMIGMRPGFRLASYAVFFVGARFSVLKRSFWVATSSTFFMLAVAYPVAYLVTFKLPPNRTRIFLFLLLGLSPWANWAHQSVPAMDGPCQSAYRLVAV